jgi:hypothetical protein
MTAQTLTNKMSLFDVSGEKKKNNFGFPANPAE